MDKNSVNSTQISQNNLRANQNTSRDIQNQQSRRPKQPTTSDNTEVVTLSLENQERIAQHQQMQRNFELKREAERYPVPTNDVIVRARLLQLGEEIVQPGEDVGTRRERLSDAILKYFIEQGQSPDQLFSGRIVYEALGCSTHDIEEAKKNWDEPITNQEHDSKNEVFYTEGCNDLKQARLEFAKYSLPKAQRRLDAAKMKRESIENHDIEDRNLQEYLNSVGQYDIIESQYADDRCVSRGCLNPNEDLFATSGWSGDCKIWSIPGCQLQTTLKGHSDRVISIRFHPESGKSLNPTSQANLASASADNSVKLWSLNPSHDYQKSVTLKGHEDTANYVEYHPMGRHVASSSHDQTWRLWDIETQKQLLLQEGHTAAVYPLSFHKDGSLIASGDLHGVCHLWDLRTGKSILAFEAHPAKQVISLEFLNTGQHLATGSDDNTVKIWDLRKKESVTTIPAHSKLVSDIKFEQDHQSKLMFTTSYDHKCKIWGSKNTLYGQNLADDWILLRTLQGHENKVTSISHTKNLKYIITTSFDKTFKLWKEIKK